jgi:outer membrane protein assembly factor BamB
LTALVSVAACTGPETATEIWRFRTGYPVAAAPVYADGRLYAGSDRLYCLDAASGAQLWSFMPYGVIKAPVVVAGGRVYLQCGGLYCLDARNGRLLWEFWEEEWSDSMPALTGGYVYVLAGTALICLDAATGSKTWQSPGLVQPAGAVADGERIYVGGMGEVAGFDARSGTPLWRVVNRQGRLLPTVYQRRVYYGSRDGFVDCLDGSSGAIIWSRRMEFPVITRITADEDRVFVFSNRIFALKADTGETVMEHAPVQPVGIHQPFRTDGGDIFVPALGGRLYVLHPDRGIVRGPWRVPSGRFCIDRSSYFGSSGYEIICLKLYGRSP